MFFEHCDTPQTLTMHDFHNNHLYCITGDSQHMLPQFSSGCSWIFHGLHKTRGYCGWAQKSFNIGNSSCCRENSHWDICVHIGFIWTELRGNKYIYKHFNLFQIPQGLYDCKHYLNTSESLNNTIISSMNFLHVVCCQATLTKPK